MFLHYRTQGLILKKEDQGEADQLFTVYTKDFGKLEILGRAIRKISSKLRSGIEIFYLSEIEFIQGKAHKTLTDVILIEKFKNLRNDLKKLSIAYKISEVFDNLFKGQEADEKIWQLLLEVFAKLNDLRFTIYDLRLLYYYFFWNILSILGYQPQLYNCVSCQKKLKPEKLFFNPKEGGIICQNCFKKVKLGKPPHLFIGGGGKPEHIRSYVLAKEINPETVKILRIILERNWRTLSKLKIEKTYLKSLNLISKEWYFYIHNNF